MYIIPLCKSNYVLFEVQCVIMNKSEDKKNPLVYKFDSPNRLYALMFSSQ